MNPVHRFFDWLLRIEHPRPEPDWQALVDAVDLAADIANPRLSGNPTRHVIRGRWAAQIVADFYNRVWFIEAIDGELFALDAALAGFYATPKPVQDPSHE